MAEPFSTSSTGPSAAAPIARGAIDDQAVIDQALEVIHAEWRRIAGYLAPDCATAVGLAQLRDGPAGRDLRRLAAVARGELTADPEHVDQAVESVLHLLYWPAGATAFAAPDGFWQTALGGMLARARARARQAAGRAPEPARGIEDAGASLPPGQPLGPAPENPGTEAH